MRGNRDGESQKERPKMKEIQKQTTREKQWENVGFLKSKLREHESGRKAGVRILRDNLASAYQDITVSILLLMQFNNLSNSWHFPPFQQQPVPSELRVYEQQCPGSTQQMLPNVSLHVYHNAASPQCKQKGYCLMSE